MFSSFVYRHRYLPAAFGVFLLVGADGKGCSCGPPDDEVIVDVVEVVTPEVTLQVVSVNPSRVEADSSASATIYGSGFEQGAVVNVGSVAASNVRVVDDGSISLTVPGLTAGRYDIQVRLPSGETATLRNAITAANSTPQCSDITVFFDTGRDALTSAAQSALDADIACYTGRSDGMLLEGHADERGTTDYNLALGQRRAEAVKRYIAGKGVPASRIRTLSLGEERPSDRGHTESSWSKNRRVEIHVGQ